MGNDEGIISILLTSAGRRVELVRAFRDAYEKLGVPGKVIAVDIDPLAPALQVADGSYIVPSLASREYIPILVDICGREHVRSIFPLIDPDIPVLAAHREPLERTGAKLASVPSRAAEVAADKWQTIELFRSLELDTPISWKAANDVPSNVSFPLFLKPRIGSAGKHTFIVHDRKELEFFGAYIDDPLIQEFMTGPEITNDVICDYEGSVLSVVSRQRIEVRWGEVAKGVTLYEPRIVEACKKVARALEARGPITVQCFVKDGTPFFTEINARLGGGAPLGIAAGVDWPSWLLASAAGIPFEVPPMGTYRRGLYMTRFDESYFLTREDLDKITRSRL